MTVNCVGLNYNKQDLIGCAVPFLRLGEPSGMYLAPRLMEGWESLPFKARGAQGLECGGSSFLGAFHWSCLMNCRDILCIRARRCLVKTRLWKPARAQCEEPRSPSLALCCGRSSPPGCQVSHLESSSRFAASLVPAHGQPHQGT